MQAEVRESIQTVALIVLRRGRRFSLTQQRPPEHHNASTREQ
jgi:hypothetical protein